MYVAKDLKTMRALSSYLSSHHPQSLVHLYFQVCQSRVTFLFTLPLILYSDYVERICFNLPPVGVILLSLTF
jgi:hypothetical protein